MKFIVSASSNYPNKDYGRFLPNKDKSIELEYLLFREKEKIEIEINIEFNKNIDSDKWNSFPLDKVNIFMIDDYFASFLKEICLGEFELVKFNLISDKKLINKNYHLLHILNHSRENGNICFDSGIYVSDFFVKEYKKRKLKGWVFYDR